jgi:hypothetical protein
MSQSNLDNEDVVSMPANTNLTKLEIFRIKALKAALKEHLHFKEWIDEGMPCEILQTTGGGWQKGKICLRLEFIPDEPPPQPPTALGVLDDLRVQNNS